MGDFVAEVEMAFADVANRQRGYPPGFRESRFGVLQRGISGETGFGFSHVLPFWLEETFGFDRHVSHSIAVSNVYALCYFRMQDAVMDKDALDEGCVTYLLTMSNLIFYDFIAPYRLLFPGKASFWSFFEKYMGEWAQSVLWEKEEHWGKLKPFSTEDIILLARKAAPLKIPCIAACLLADREDAIESLEKMVDYWQVMIQFKDDCRDWRKDMEQQNITFLLAKVMDFCQIQDVIELDAGKVKRAIVVGGLFDEVLAIAAQYGQMALDSINDLNATYLKSYLCREIEECEISRQKAKALVGQWRGFGKGMV